MAGLLVGYAADSMMGSIPEPRTSGQKFDAVVLRVLDMVRGLGGVNLMGPYVTDTSTITIPGTYGDIWTHPECVEDFMRLAALGRLDEFPLVSFGISTPSHSMFAVVTNAAHLSNGSLLLSGKYFAKHSASGSSWPLLENHTEAQSNIHGSLTTDGIDMPFQSLAQRISVGDWRGAPTWFVPSKPTHLAKDIALVVIPTDSGKPRRQHQVNNDDYNDDEDNNDGDNSDDHDVDIRVL
eukprot:gnl/MRDRNA2_/MRDRNA2_84679_c0_seq1.p1 gnl/MRDRNA2_/MRDRNA2_84679_c0~~gnl/MRDRNA2_/MRDRNA2_84679_c0_seq1.p1  ORF type:complete len:269 (+),score=45.48 gnl/MRDRNA2_/MRDRNA2_84679_c0_seq1:98-808(+)